MLWNPPTSLPLGPISIRYYSLCWCIGLLAAYLIVQRLYRQQNIEKTKFEPLFFYCFIGVLVGARLGHCLLYDPGYFLSHPIEMFLPIREVNGGWKFTGYSGLASHGGTLGLMIALWLYVRKYKVGIWTVLDNVAIATPFTAFCIRIGNLMNSEIVGTPTESAFGFIFVQNGESFARHPSQLYEAIAYLVLFFLGWWLYRKQSGKVGTGLCFGACLTGIFTFRLFVECLKEVQEPWEVSMQNAIGLNQGQVLSIPFIILGVVCVWRALRKKQEIINK